MLFKRLLVPLWAQVVRLGLFLVLVFCVYILLGQQGMGYINRYAGTVQQTLSDALGQPVSIGQLTGQWQGLGPIIIAQDVTIGQMLQVGQLRADIGFLTSLASGRLTLDDVTLSQVEVMVPVHSARAWLMPLLAAAPGLEPKPEAFAAEAAQTAVSADNQPLNEWLNWLRHQQQIQLQSVTLSLHDAQQQLFAVDIDWLNWSSYDNQQWLSLRGRLHDARGSAPLKLALLSQDSLMAGAQTRAYIEHGAIDWWDILQPLMPQSLPLASWQMAGQHWLTWSAGQLSRWDAQLSDTTVVHDSEQAMIQGLSAHLSWLPQSQGFELLVDQLQFRQVMLHNGPVPSDSGIQWPASRHRVQYRTDTHSLRLTSDRIVLEPITHVLHLWFDSDVLRQIRPSGQLLSSELFWQSAQYRVDAKPHLRLSGLATGLTVQSGRGVPGVGPINGYLDLTQSQGQLVFHGRQAKLFVASMYDQPWVFKQLSGRLSWHYDEHLGAVIQGDSIKADYPLLSGLRGRFQVAIPARVDLQQGLRERYFGLQLAYAQGSLADLAHYLPDRGLGEGTKDWLVTQIDSGQSTQGALLYAGAPEKPYAASFDYRTQIQQGRMAFLPNWPEIDQVNTRLHISQDALTAQVKQARFAQHVLTQAQVYLPFTQQQVQIQTQVQSQLPQTLSWLQQSPLRTQIGSWLDDWQALAGQLQAQVQLVVPLNAANQAATVQMQAQLEQGKLQHQALNLMLEQVNGAFTLDSRQGFSAPKLQARFLETLHEIEIAADFNRASPPTVRTQGQLHAQALGRWLQDPWLQQVVGQAAYRGQLQFYPDRVNVSLSSNLQGIELALPEPLGKTAEQARGLDLSINRVEQGYEFVLAYDDLLFARITREQQRYSGEIQLGVQQAAQTGSTDRSLEVLTRKAPLLAVQPPVLNQSEAIEIQIYHDRLVLDEWQATLESLQALYQPNPLADVPAVMAQLKSPASPSLVEQIQSITVHAQQVVYHGTEVTVVNAQVRQTPEAWIAQFSSQQVQGVVSLSKASEIPLFVDLDYLHLRSAADQPPLASEANETIADPWAQMDMERIPQASVQIRNVVFNDQDYGAWSFVSRPQPQGVLIEQINGFVGGVKAQGTLNWARAVTASAEGSIPVQTQLQLELAANDISAVLTHWQYTPVLNSRSSRAQVTLSWPGSPAAFDYHRLQGQISMRLTQGRVANTAQLDGLKLVGIMNFTKMVNRLALDFRDIAGQGINYDELTGTVGFEPGRAYTQQPLAITGSSMRISFKGEADLYSNALTGSMITTVPLSTSFPIVAFLASLSPQVFAAAVITERLLNDQLEKITTFKAIVSGTLQNPEYRFITSRNRK